MKSIELRDFVADDEKAPKTMPAERPEILRQALADLRGGARLPLDYEFSFNGLASAKLRRRVFETLAQADFEAWAVIADKTALPDSFKFMRRLDFYLYFVTELLKLMPERQREGATLILDEFGAAGQRRLFAGQGSQRLLLTLVYDAEWG